jgi:hypothetical protein
MASSRIITTHIREMLQESQRLAEAADGKYVEDVLNADGRQPITAGDALSRAANLALHASAELRDEVDVGHGW